MGHSGTWFSGGLRGAGLTVGLYNLKVFSNLKDSMILNTGLLVLVYDVKQRSHNMSSGALNCFLLSLAFLLL